MCRSALDEALDEAAKSNEDDFGFLIESAISGLVLQIETGSVM